MVAIVWLLSLVPASGARRPPAGGNPSASARASGVFRPPISCSSAKKCSSSLLVAWLVVTADLAQGSTAQQDLLLTLSSPISGLARISVDFDEDRDIGEHEAGTLRAFRLHPILPIDLDSRFRLVSDTVLAAGDRDTALQETLSLSPARAQASGFQWATGAAARFESGGAWGIGPSLTLLQEDANEVSGLTLAHRWSASEDHGDLSTLDAFTTWTRNGTGLTLRVEASYDERTQQMLVPVSVAFRRLFNTGPVGVAVDLRARYYVDIPSNDGRWGVGVGLTFTRRFAQ